MGETTNQIEWEIAQKRSELSDNLIELKHRAKAAVDWRSQVEERPGTMLAVAFAGGIALSALFSALRGPVKVYAQRPSGNPIEYDSPISRSSARPPGKFATATRKNLDALGGGPNPGRNLLPLAVSVLKHGHRPLELVLEHALEGVQVPLDVDEGRLHLLHVDGAGELQVQLVESQQVRQRHPVADDHHVPLVRVDDGAAAHVVRGVGDDR